MESVMDMARMAFGAETLSRISSWLRESPAGTKAAVQDALPVSILGVADQASTEEGSRALLDRLQSGDYPHLEAEDLSRTLKDPANTDRVVESHQGFMDGLFGGKLGSVIEGMSEHTGVSRAGISKVLGLATPLVLAMIGKRTITDKLDAGGLRNFLVEQRTLAAGMLPGSLSRLLAPGAAPPVLSSAPTTRAYAEHGHGAFPWWLVGLVALAGLMAFSLSRMRHRQARRPPPMRSSELILPAVPPADHVPAMAFFLERGAPAPAGFLVSTAVGRPPLP
jgi:hypothetical protein